MERRPSCVGGGIASSTWVKFLVGANYTTSKYSLYLNDNLVASDYNFYSSSNADFQVTNATPGTPTAADVTIVLGDATPGGTYRLLASDGNPDGVYTPLGNQTVGGSAPFNLVDTGILSDNTVTTRFYRVVDVIPGDTNETVWVMHRQRRQSARWYAVGSPVNYGGNASNNSLHKELGRQLARGLTGGPNTGNSPLLFVWNQQSADWARTI